MAILSRTLALSALFALALPLVNAQTNTCQDGDDGADGAQCLVGLGDPDFASAYCSSVLTITIPTTTVVQRVSSTEFASTTTTTLSDVVTVTPDFPVATTVFVTATVGQTITVGRFNTTVIGTAMGTASSVNTKTVTSIINTTTYTCADPTFTAGSASTSSLHFPSAPKNITDVPYPTGTASGRVGPTATAAAPPYYSYGYGGGFADVRKRQENGDGEITPTLTVTAFFTPLCVSSFSAAFGQEGLNDACECLDLPAPTGTVTSTQTVQDSSLGVVTAVSTATVTSTSIFTSMITVTATANVTVRGTAFATSSATAVSSGMPTTTVTTTLTSTKPSPTPARFKIYYDSDAPMPGGNATNSTMRPSTYFQSGPVPGGGDGMVLSTSRTAHDFKLDSEGRLVDLTALGSLFLTKNTENLYPWTLLQDEASAADTAMCSACDGALTCGFEGEQEMVFALCFGYLALGEPSAFMVDGADADNDPDCQIVDLRHTT